MPRGRQDRGRLSEATATLRARLALPSGAPNAGRRTEARGGHRGAVLPHRRQQRRKTLETLETLEARLAGVDGGLGD